MIIYYTDNSLSPELEAMCAGALMQAAGDMPIITVGHLECSFGDVRLNVGTLPRCLLSIYQQIERALAYVTTDWVYLTEHDVLYPVGYFAAPVGALVYNRNIKRMSKDGFMDNSRWGVTTSSLCADVSVLRRLIAWRIDQIASGRRFSYSEPGKGDKWDGLVSYWDSPHPIVDIRHGGNLTGHRFSAYHNKDDHWGDYRDILRIAGMKARSEL